MADNPMLRVAEMANRISSGSLERIGKIQQDTYNRRLQREQLEQRTIEREAALRVQSENYEARINNNALVAEQRAIINNNADDIRRKEGLARHLEERAKLLQGEVPRLEMERDLALAEGKDTSSLDAAIASARSQMAGIREQQSQVITGLMQPSTPVPSTAPQTSVIPYPQVQDPNAIGFDRYGDEAINPTGGTDTQKFYGPAADAVPEVAPVQIQGLNYSDEEKDLWIRTVAAEVGTQVDEDGLVKMAETVRNRHLMTGKPLSEILKPNYYETMRGDNPATSQITTDSEVYQKSAAAVEAAINGSNLSNSATHNYYGPAWTKAAAKRNQADPATVEKYQKEVYYKKRGESNFNFNNYVKGEAEINLSSDRETERVGGQTMSSGSAPADGSLFPPASRPDGGGDLTLSQPSVRAVPIIEEDPELVANVDFFSSMDGDAESQVRFSDSGPVGTPAQPVDFVYDNFFDPVDATQSPTGAPHPKENPVNMEFISRINSRYEALPERDKALYLSRVQEAIRRSNPSVADDEITRRATIAVKSGTSSSVDFRNSLPPEITNIIGDARPAEIFNRIQFGIRQEEERNGQITQLERDFEDSEEKRASYALKLSQESNKKVSDGFDPNAVATLQGMVDFYTNKSESLKNQRLALDPIQPEAPQEGEPPEPPEPTALDNRVNSIVPTTTPIQADFNQSVRMTFSDLGIDPKFLADLDLEEDMGIWDKVTASFGLNSNVNENAAKIRNAFIYSRAEAAMNNEDREARLQGAVEYFNEYKQQVLNYAAGLQGISIKDDSGRSVDLYNQFAGSGDPLADLLTEGAQTNTLREKALLANPSILYGIIDSMINFDTSVRTKIVQLANKERQRKLNDLQGMFGTPMQIPADK